MSAASIRVFFGTGSRARALLYMAMQQPVQKLLPRPLGLDPPLSFLLPTLLALVQCGLCNSPEEIDPELEVSLGDTWFNL